jgi:protein-tyrosine-phosphatase
MAEAFLRDRFAERGVEFTVGSAGFARPGVPPPPHVLEVMRGVGLDLSGHRSRAVKRDIIESADLVVAMGRQHAIDISVAAPSASARCFTFADLLRRGAAAGARRPEESVAEWAIRMDAGRQRSSILALPVAEDVPDPIGGRKSGFLKVRDRLIEMTSKLTELLVPV